MYMSLPNDWMGLTRESRLTKENIEGLNENIKNPLEKLWSKIHLVSHIVNQLKPWFSTFSEKAVANKGEVSYDQWLFKVKSSKDHCPENSLQEGIVRSFKGATGDFIRYLGSRARIEQILAMLDVVHGMVASFYVLMQAFL